MLRYIAFLRGINISGKNKIAMVELRKGFEKLGFQEVKSYLNSGNVIFSSNENDRKEFTTRIEAMIRKEFGFHVSVFIIENTVLEDILNHAPDWWGKDDKAIYDNLIFIIPPITYIDVYHEIGEPKEGLEQIMNYKDVIFWSFHLKEYQKTNWWSKTASVSIAPNLTIRTANTIRKIVYM